MTTFFSQAETRVDTSGARIAEDVVGAGGGRMESGAGIVNGTMGMAAAGYSATVVDDALLHGVHAPALVAWEAGDADHDGMPNGWELTYSLDPYDPADATEDPDLDGIDNLTEYLHGTDPRVPASPMPVWSGWGLMGICALMAGWSVRRIEARA